MPDESKAKGGYARSQALTPERKREIASKAAAVRWGDKPPRATHKGNFREEFGIDVECYVLSDEAKTAVISQRGMAAALGLKDSSGLALPKFLGGAKIAPYVGSELGEKLQNPLIFQQGGVGANQPPMVGKGYDVTILIDICKSIIQAQEDGKLQKRHADIARQAHIIVSASAKAGIKGLVYALSGYDATRDEVIQAFKFFVREEARDYEKEFPDQLYQEWYRLYGIARPERNKPWKFKHLTVDQVYKPLARSNGKILELTQAQRANSSQRHQRLHQFLSEIGVKALRQHLGQLLGIARISKDQTDYEAFVQKLFGDPADTNQVKDQGDLFKPSPTAP